jgi:hypothetical protein
MSRVVEVVLFAFGRFDDRHAVLPVEEADDVRMWTFCGSTRRWPSFISSFMSSFIPSFMFSFVCGRIDRGNGLDVVETVVGDRCRLVGVEIVVIVGDEMMSGECNRLGGRVHKTQESGKIAVPGTRVDKREMAIERHGCVDSKLFVRPGQFSARDYEMVSDERNRLVGRVHKTHERGKFAVPGTRIGKCNIATSRQGCSDSVLFIRPGQCVTQVGRRAERSARPFVDPLRVVIWHEILGGKKTKRETALWGQHCVGEISLGVGDTACGAATDADRVWTCIQGHRSAGVPNWTACGSAVDA